MSASRVLGILRVQVSQLLYLLLFQVVPFPQDGNAWQRAPSELCIAIVCWERGESRRLQCTFLFAWPEVFRSGAQRIPGVFPVWRPGLWEEPFPQFCEQEFVPLRAQEDGLTLFPSCSAEGRLEQFRRHPSQGKRFV